MTTYLAEGGKELQTLAPDQAVASLLHFLEGYRFPLGTEEELQEHLATAMSFLKFEREVRLSKDDRIDFMVGPVGIEVKIGGSVGDLTRQVHRYMQHDRLNSLLIVTSRASHNRVPREINGKPIRVLHLYRSAF